MLRNRTKMADIPFVDGTLQKSQLLTKDRTLLRLYVVVRLTLTVGAGTITHKMTGGIKNLLRAFRLTDGQRHVFSAGSWMLDRSSADEKGDSIAAIDFIDGATYGASTVVNELVIPIDFIMDDLNHFSKLQNPLNLRGLTAPQLYFESQLEPLANIYGGTATLAVASSEFKVLTDDARELNEVFPVRQLVEGRVDITAANVSWPGYEIELPRIGDLRRIHLRSVVDGLNSDALITNLTVRLSSDTDIWQNVQWNDIGAMNRIRKPGLTNRNTPEAAPVSLVGNSIQAGALEQTGYRVLDYEDMAGAIDRLHVFNERKFSLHVLTPASLPGATRTLYYMLDRVIPALY